VYYFKDEFPDIDINDPKQVNVLKKGKHPKESLRQDSKPATFALTYQGTWRTLVANLGWSPDKAKAVAANYQEMYRVSVEYVNARLERASKDGYVEVAFGLRVRTPLLAQVILGAAKVPAEAAAEGRTAGNALGQSYGLLNNRAAVAFWKKVWASPYRYQILPSALVHDAIYAVITDDIEVVDWANLNLIAEMRWQELPEIQHDTVKLGAAMDIFWPSWANPTTIPNEADRQTIIDMCTEARAKYLEKAHKETA
jgi:DNA polymerase I